MSIADLRNEIAALTAAYRIDRRSATAFEAVELRMKGGRQLLDAAGPLPEAPDTDDIFGVARGLPEIDAAELGSQQIAAGLLNYGSLVVRGLYDERQVELLRDLAGREVEEPLLRTVNRGRPLSPTLTVELLDLYSECGLLDAVGGYLDGPTLAMAERLVLRLRTPERRAGVLPWHQDANFFGKTCRAVNCWAAVTACGTESPGLEFHPRRLHERIGWDGDGRAPIDYGKAIDPAVLARLAAEQEPVEMSFAPGDAVLFDEFTLHRTSRKPWRVSEQLVTVAWFFPPAGFPELGTPVLV